MSFLRYLAVLVAAAVLLIAGLTRAPSPGHGFLGLEFAPLTRAAFERAPPLARHGALIAYVYPLGPADVAELKAGEIVTAINGTIVESASHAADLVDAHKAGDKLVLTVLDVTMDDPKPKKVPLILLPGRPPSKTMYTVRPTRTLAREWDFGPTMAANASWSARIARGAVRPFPLSLFKRGGCSGLAPDGWAIVHASDNGTTFALASAGRHVKAIYLFAPLADARNSGAQIADALKSIFGMPPQLGLPRDIGHGYGLVLFGTLNNYAGFVIYRVDRQNPRQPMILLRIAGVPATEVEGLEPLAGAVALSIRCTRNGDAGRAATVPRPHDVPRTAVSSRCAEDDMCEESDLAGAYNDHLHTGYVHSEAGDNFLIDPRKDIWAMGPNGAGTYRQIGGAVELLAPGRTN